MFISFDPFLLLFWVFVTSFIPGSILSLALFNKTQLRLIEKILIGFGIGFAGPSVIYFLLSLAGIHFSYNVALASVGIFYLFSIYIFKKENVQLDLSSFKFDLSRDSIISILLVALLFLTYFLRMTSYSPIFQELDPYYYTFAATQLLTVGENPFDDKTAWYPLVTVSHREFPLLGNFESIWYSFYTSGGAYDPYILSLVAGQYPPIAAAFAVFFVYLLISTFYKREWGLIAAATLSFIPIFIYKFSAGEMESQPFAFFSISFFLFSYLFAMKTKDLKFLLLAAFSYSLVALGSASQIVVFSSLLIFMGLHSIFLVFKRDKNELLAFIRNNLIFVVAGPIFIVTILYKFVRLAQLDLTTNILLLLPLAFAYLLLLIKEKVKDIEMIFYYFSGFIVLGLLLFVFTPVGDVVKSVAFSGIGAGQVDNPLERTIAEQGDAGSSFAGELGFIAYNPDQVAFIFLRDSKHWLWSIVKTFADVLYLLFTWVINVTFAIATELINTAFGSSLNYVEKVPSFIMLILFFSVVSFMLSFRQLMKGEENFSIFFVIVIVLPTIIGLLKTKYSIYAGFLVIIGFGFVLGELFNFLSNYFKSENNQKILYYIFLVIGLLIFIGQFSSSSAGPILGSTFTQRFQDNPLATQQEFHELCSDLQSLGTRDDLICAAAQNPTELASLNINYQYSAMLCMLSLSSDPLKLYQLRFDLRSPEIPDSDKALFQHKCNTLAPYWVDSMDWISKNTPEGARIISWWDYGHWINYFGHRNAVVRNEHASTLMIGEVANAYIDGTPEDLKKLMNSYDSEYALFDSELIGGPDFFGNKYGALNYLSCARNNETSVQIEPGNSICESEHTWETIYLPQQPVDGDICVISETDQKYGILAYTFSYSVNNNRLFINGVQPIYCVGDLTLSDNRTVSVTYKLNEKDENGNLKLNKATIGRPLLVSNALDYESNIVIIPTHSRDEQMYSSILRYTNEEIWLENGTVKSGYEDRTKEFYSSNLYRAYILEDLPGFELVYKNSDVKIYKIKD